MGPMGTAATEENMTTVEVETDSRGRVPLGRIVDHHQRYRATAHEDGEITLTPIVTVSQRELNLLRNPELTAKLRNSIAEAEAGKLTAYDPGPVEDDE
jgi:hypothetical protein